MRICRRNREEREREKKRKARVPFRKGLDDGVQQLDQSTAAFLARIFRTKGPMEICPKQKSPKRIVVKTIGESSDGEMLFQFTHQLFSSKKCFVNALSVRTSLWMKPCSV